MVPACIEDVGRGVERRKVGEIMDDKQVMHAMSLDDAYHVDQVLARGSGGVTELVGIGGVGPFVRKKIPLQLARRNVWSALGECSSPRLPRVEATYELPDCFVVIYDYVAGESLESVVSKRGRMPLDVAVTVMGQLCEAVGELHAHGIVHRDISPKNVIMASDGAHLIDLGISRMHAEKPVEHDTTILGTWGFAPAEQYGFAQTDSRSDIYSLGRLLGYLLTGVYPTDNDYERLLNDDDVVDGHTRAVIARACALEPSARQQTAMQFMDELTGRAQAPVAQKGARPSGMDGHHVRRGAGSLGTAARHLRDSVVALPMSTRVVGVISMLLCVALVVVLCVGSIGRPGHDSAEPKSSGTSSSTGESSQPHAEKQEQSDTNVPSAGMDNDAQQQNVKLLEIGESGWYARDGYVNYAVELRNTSADKGVSVPEVSIVGKDKDGKILFTDKSIVIQIDAGQTVWVGGSAGDGVENPVTVEFKTVESSMGQYTSEGEWSFSSDSLNISKSEDTTNFTGELRLTSRTSGIIYSNVKLALVLRDKNGRIVYGDMEFVPMPDEGEPRAFSITEMNDEIPKYATFEVYAQPSI